MTRDQGTQTEEVKRELTLPKIAEMDDNVTELYARIRLLENQLRALRATPSPPPTELDPDVSSDVLQIQRYNQRSKSIKNKRSKKRSSGVLESTSVSARDTEVSDDEWRPEEHKPSKQSFRETPHSKGTNLGFGHSLTGKPTPAFPDKSSKKRLEPELVNDIVQIVVERCKVPESAVRTSITTKCADESKMYRNRQQTKKKGDSQKRNQENVPPSSYDDSS